MKRAEKSFFSNRNIPAMIEQPPKINNAIAQTILNQVDRLSGDLREIMIINAPATKNNAP